MVVTEQSTITISMAAVFTIFGLRFRLRRRVRPWALAGPILILLYCLPLLRPLRHPDPRDVSDNENGRLATVQAVVENHSLAIDASSFRLPPEKMVAVGPDHYAAQPATMAVLLAGAYWVMLHLGLTFADHGPTVTYVLTLLGVTLPVAAAAGLIYRMGRLFELERPYRAALGLACVVGTGLISYATVLNAHAPAAVLVLCAAACLIHVARAPQTQHSAAWLATAGFCGALAGAIDLPATIFFLLFIPAIFSFRWTMSRKWAGLIIYVIGMVPPLMLHAYLTLPVTGSLLPPPYQQELHAVPVAAPAPTASDDLDDYSQSIWQTVGDRIGRVLAALIGDHGLLSHFPILLLGVIGVSKVMHRHWPSSTKLLAGATVAGAAIIILVFAFGKSDWRDAMFAARWFIVFSPLLLFWTGAWLRKAHRPTSWAIMGVGLAFSVIVSLIGATGPWPKGGFDTYTVAGAAKNLFSVDTTMHDTLAAR